MKRYLKVLVSVLILTIIFTGFVHMIGMGDLAEYMNARYNAAQNAIYSAVRIIFSVVVIFLVFYFLGDIKIQRINDGKKRIVIEFE